MAINPAPLHANGRRLNRDTSPPEKTTGLSFLEIPITDIADGWGGTLRPLRIRRVNAPGDIGEHSYSLFACLVDREHGMARKDHAAKATIRTAVLKDI